MNLWNRWYPPLDGLIQETKVFLGDQKCHKYIHVRHWWIFLSCISRWIIGLFMIWLILFHTSEVTFYFVIGSEHWSDFKIMQGLVHIIIFHVGGMVVLKQRSQQFFVFPTLLIFLCIIFSSETKIFLCFDNIKVAASIKSQNGWLWNLEAGFYGFYLWEIRWYSWG